MDYKWIITENFIYGYNSLNNTNITNYNNLYFFDLDDTIITTKSGKKFSISNTDWIWLDNSVPIKINKLFNKNIIGIFTNQKGLRTFDLKNNWIKKIKDILTKLNIHFIFASTKDDRYRKPLTGSWDYIYTNYFNYFNNSEIIKNKKKYFIGDALGRQNDFSDTDLKFAMNCNFIIKSPEKFFNLPNLDNKASITYPQLKYYSNDEQNNIINNLFNVINTNKNNKILIICIGLPASGKSFIRNMILKKYDNFKYINNDDINNYKKNNIKSEFFNKLILDNKLQDIENKYIINDNTNIDNKKRNKYLEDYKNYFKIAIFFNYDIDICMHLNYMRMFYFNTPLISKVVYRTLLKSNSTIFNNNKLDEFNYFIIIDKLFTQFNLNNIKYFY